MGSIPIARSNFHHSMKKKKVSPKKTSELTEVKFWALIDRSVRESKKNPEKFAAVLTEKLKKTSPQKIIQFDDYLSQKIVELYSDGHWEAAEEITGDSISDDGFEYFRAWVVGQGKKVFEAALENPSSLLSHGKVKSVKEAELEDLLYVAQMAYESKTKKDWLDRPSYKINPVTPAKKSAAHGPVKKSDFIKAVKSGKTDAVGDLIKRGADVNVKSNDGWTALMCTHLVDIARLLIENGADIHARGSEDQTPLIHACRYGYTPIARLLIEKGAVIDARNKEGYTALIEAALNGCANAALLLIESGANLNLRNESGCTALIYASMNGYTEIVRLLLEKGADPNMKGDGGRTALLDASRNGYAPVVELLNEHRKRQQSQ